MRPAIYDDAVRDVPVRPAAPAPTPA